MHEYRESLKREAHILKTELGQVLRELSAHKAAVISLTDKREKLEFRRQRIALLFDAFTMCGIQDF